SSLPGVVLARVSNGAMLDGIQNGGRTDGMKAEGRTVKPGLMTRAFSVAPGFFDAAGMRLIAGRDLSDEDTDASPRVAVINQTYARYLYGNESPVGRRYGGVSGDQIEVVGVIKDAAIGAVGGEMGVSYSSYRQNPNTLRGPWCVAIRTKGD